MDKNEKQSSLWSWKTDEADIENQIKNYYSLKITESYRGISVLIICGALLLTLGVSFFGIDIDTESAIYSIIIYSPIIFFVYKGHRWAIVSLMALWTFEKGYQIVEIISLGEGSVGGIFFWWIIIMPYFWKALKVENEKRRKKSDGNNQIKIEPEHAFSGKNIFCSNCGNEINSIGSFCKHCGKKLN